MSIAATESRSPLGESQVVERRTRLEHLAWMVFELMAFRLHGATSHEFDNLETPELIAALRACSSYTAEISCLDFGDSLVVQIVGIDGHDYFVQFSLFGPRISLHAARVRTSKFSMVGREGRADSTYKRMNALEEHSQRLKLGTMTTDRAFLIGMSMVISFMDDQDDDPDEDTRLAPLMAQTMPSREELREIRAKLPLSTINYDDEGDQPF